MMRYLSLNFGGDDCASLLFRIESFRPALRSLGLDVDSELANDFRRWNEWGELSCLSRCTDNWLVSKMKQPRDL